MALTFVVLAAASTVGGGWLVRANQYGRILAMAPLAIFGLTLLWDGLADRLSRPLTDVGATISARVLREHD
jgi:hypothetical protein